MMNLLYASSRVAFAAMIHDLGKLAQRADLPVTQEQKETHLQLYCPHHREGNWWSHHHAAYTSLAFDVIEKNAPELIRGEMAPFASRDNENQDITDSLVNAAAKHHNPQTLLQWIIATADRVASGFEREEFEKYNSNNGNPEEIAETGKNFLQARMLTLFEQIRLNDNDKTPLTAGAMKWCYPLRPLSPESIFPSERQKYEPSDNDSAQKQYAELWEAFKEELEKIPPAHRQSWPLWLDHFDTAWLTYTHAVPSATAFGVKPDVSLYDHSKATAALAVALWRYHHRHPQEEREAIRKIADRTASGDWGTQKYLLIQGDFFGIQDFIFAEGSQTNRQAAKLLRGRSFYVSMLMEIAALKILETLELPSTSQIINAAGKFLIVADNSDETRTQLENIRQELDQWFLENTFGIAGIGLAWQPASCNDFLKGRDKDGQGGFKQLTERLFEELDTIKLQRFSLCEKTSPVLPLESFDKPCQWHGHMPSDVQNENDNPSCAISRDQIMIGERIVSSSRILILKAGDTLREDNIALCELPVFGYRVAFTQDEEQSGKFAELVKNGTLRRCWDFSLPKDMKSVLWDGYARRNINGYIPRFNADDLKTTDKYTVTDETGDNNIIADAAKTFNHIACEDRRYNKDKWEGQIALTTLKGDVDNLGTIFQKGLHNPARQQYSSFAKMAALSRQMNSFFAVWLPAKCATDATCRNTYTVFAGGDDFFMIGPWYSTQKLATEIVLKFQEYTTKNPDIHLSAGMTMSKPGYPVHSLAEAAEDALTEAKHHPGKNAVHLFRQTVSWNDWKRLAEAERRIAELQQDYGLSTGYLYSLFFLIDKATMKSSPEASLWRSQLAYRTARTLESIQDETARRKACTAIVTDIGQNGIATFGGAYRIPLFNHFYRQR